MTTAVIVQARLGSSRLPAKVLLPLPTGRTVLEEVLHRCKQIPGVDVVVCAIPDTAENDILVPHMAARIVQPAGDQFFVERAGGPVIVRGPEHDVLARYAKAAEAVGADVIMRVTADCPLIDPKVCGEVLALRQSADVDYASNVWPRRSYPQGFDCEVFTREALERAHREIPQLSADPGSVTWVKDGDFEATARALKLATADREHATPWMQRHEDISIACLEAEVDRSHERLTLDTLADYAHIWNVFEQQMREAA